MYQQGWDCVSTAVIDFISTFSKIRFPASTGQVPSMSEYRGKGVSRIAQARVITVVLSLSDTVRVGVMLCGYLALVQQ